MPTPFRAVLLLIAASVAGAALADEGMWTYDDFPAAKMRAAYGWAPDAAWLEHARLGSIRLALGCSASLVSSNGLVMTNHHCARECVSDLADAQHDYSANGYYAAAAADEKKCPAMEANQLVNITDVTQQMEAATAGKSDRAFHEAERAAKAQIESACGTASDVRCQVVTLYEGGVYDLYKYKRYQDLRLVFVPEDSVAFFGGDPDNFTFPRYDLDAAFVRIYDNGKPLHTETYLKFATKGVKQGDIAFTSGNPGSTERDETLAELEFQRDYAQPLILNLFSELRGILTEFATKGAEQERTSKTLLFSIENSLKAYKGRQLALVQGPLISDKARAEKEFRKRAAADPNLAAKYGGAWDAVSAAVVHQRDIFVRNALLERYPQRLSELMAHAVALNRYAAESGKADGERLEEYSDANAPALRQQIVSPAPIHADLEKTVLTWWLTKVREYLGTSDPDVRRLLGNQSPEEVASTLVAGTKLGDSALRTQLLDGRASAIEAYHDPLIDFARALDVPARAVRADYENSVKAVKTKNASLIAKARFALEGKGTYPDATFTLRLSYGAVAGYQDNGHSVAPATNFAGAYAHATGREPFKLPASWITAQKGVDPNTQLNFVSTNDIIGGNSGSPVIGRNGEVIGLIFDGNIQSLGGDFGYDGSLNRAVAVDVTGITEALKNIYHADRLVKELAH
ncbi:MAG TPA: S46 family peptidase [Steroidobacteraceae bacterium]|nr:S46 family peptidase [Steroidobacteraceae bacterium]